MLSIGYTHIQYNTNHILYIRTCIYVCMYILTISLWVLIFKELNICGTYLYYIK